MHAVRLVHRSRAKTIIAHVDVDYVCRGQPLFQSFVEVARSGIPRLPHTGRSDPNQLEFFVAGGAKDVFDTLVQVLDRTVGIVGAERQKRQRSRWNPLDLLDGARTANVIADMRDARQVSDIGQAYAMAVAQN